MARKTKKTKKDSRLKSPMKYELLGLLFIFLAIFGSGASAISDGAIPGGLENIFRFIFGIWYFVASIGLFITGIILFIKRKYPNFLNKKLIGFYIGFLGILLFTHIQAFEQILITTEGTSIVKDTWINIFSYINGQGTVIQTGGGMVGGILFAFNYYLFSSIGAKIVAVFSIIIGFIFMTELSLGDLFSKLGEKISSYFKKINNYFKEYKRKRKLAKEEEDQHVPNSDLIPDEVNEEPVIEDFTDIAYSFNQPDETEPPVKVTKPEVEEESTELPIDTSKTIDKENYEYELPSSNLLEEPSHNSQQYEKSQIQATVRTLEKTFHSFGVKAKVTKVHVGPAVTKYEIYPEAGVKVSRIVNLHDDLALALAAQDIRIEAPIPGKSAEVGS